MPSEQIVTGREPGSVHTVVRHLWMPLLESGLGRVVLGQHTEPGWTALHTFSLQPLRSRARLLVSSGEGRTLARALASYRRLRTPPAQVGRLLIAGKVAPGLRRAGNLLTVETKDFTRASTLEPISVMEKIAGKKLFALVGIRDSANGKATLQLFDHAGIPASYAKLAWNAHTSKYVRTEATTLGNVSFARKKTCVPRLVAEGTIGNDLPYLVTEPLPGSVRRVSGGTDLTDMDVASLFHTIRHAPLRETGQFHGVIERLERARQALEDAELASLTGRLIDTLSGSDVALPVLERWHGDLVPWNSAMDSDGTLWLWDWESSETDAVAGLDVLHWLLNRGKPTKGATLAERLQDASHEAVGAMRAVGVDSDNQSVVTGAYALTFAERNWSLAATNAGWSRHRVGREATLGLLKFGLMQMGT